MYLLRIATRARAKDLRPRLLSLVAVTKCRFRAQAEHLRGSLPKYRPAPIAVLEMVRKMACLFREPQWFAAASMHLAAMLADETC